MTLKHLTWLFESKRSSRSNRDHSTETKGLLHDTGHGVLIDISTPVDDLPRNEVFDL